MDSCEHLDDLLRAETKIMKKHIKDHKWFQHIPDTNDAYMDFIDKYGWLMREMYCGYVCDDRYDCLTAKKYLVDKNENSNYEE